MRVLPGLGDMLCAVPALRAARRTVPRGRITLIGLDRSAWFAARFGHYIDHFLPCPVWPGLAEIDGPGDAATPFLRATRRCTFDLAVQMHGDGRASNRLTAALGSRRWIGLLGDGAAPDDGRGTVAPYPTDRHEIDRCCDVLALAGIVADDRALEFPLTPEEERTAAEVAPPGTSFAIVHPGASRRSTRWSPDGFGAVAVGLLASVDRVFLTGTSSERDVVAAVRHATGDRTEVVDLSGATGLGVLGALMRRAAVVVANDTGAAHLGAAVGGRVVTVCGPTDQVRWAPRGDGTCTVGGVPFGRWPTTRQVRTTIDHVLAGATQQVP